MQIQDKYILILHYKTMQMIISLSDELAVL